jgi:hypothetical protein
VTEIRRLTMVLPIPSMSFGRNVSDVGVIV